MAAGSTNFPGTDIDDNGVKDSSTEITSKLFNDAYEQIEAIQTKVGVNSSAVVTSIDYLVKSSSSTNPGHKHPESKVTFDTSAGHDHDGTDSKLLPFVGARAYLAADQENIADTTYTKILLNTETYDIGGNFASNKFTALVNGYYQISAMLRWKNTVADKLYLGAVYKNGGAIITAYANAGSNTSISICMSDIVYLAATNYIELYAYHSSAAATPDIEGGSNDTFMSIALLKEV